MPGYCMQIVAHEDDDLFFINPDVQAAIDAGLPAVTVYVTAGQLSGNGTTDGQRASNRQLGAMAAHAHMAGVASPQWSGGVLWMAGRQVEHYTLTNAASPVELVFCNLSDGGLNAVATGGSATTVLVTGGLVTRTFTYTSTDVLNVLAGLLARYQPTVLRAQDPLPDARYTADHLDHQAVAHWVDTAAAAYADDLLVVHYRDYNIGDVPGNLNSPETDAKTATAQAYIAYDTNAAYSQYMHAMYQRWPSGSAWIGHNADGRLQVFVVRSGLLWTWYQLASGGWSAPCVLGGSGGPLAPTITVAPNADGRLQVFARRTSDHHIVTVWQSSINGPWVAVWGDLGNPNSGMSNADQVGCPAVVRAGDGCIQLVLRNGGGGLSGLLQSSPNGGWPSAWADLHGTDVQGDPALAIDPAGLVHVLAATTTGLLHWYQTATGGAFTLDTATVPAPVPGSAPDGVRCADGSIAVVYRASTGQVTVTTQTAPSSGWGQPVTVGGEAGPTESTGIAPSGSGHQPMLVARGVDGQVAVAVAAGGVWTWSVLPGVPVVGTPAVVFDAAGLVTIAAVGMDGVVRVCQQTAAGGGASFGPWQPLVNT